MQKKDTIADILKLILRIHSITKESFIDIILLRIQDDFGESISDEGLLDELESYYKNVKDLDK